ncbi:MAG: hypothetical protein NC095_07505 [Muribaculum sp.]|nr:hypothetical protein [Muribaculum sp.]
MRLGLKQYELIADMTKVSSVSEMDYEKNLRKRIEMLKEIAIEDFVSSIPKSLLRSEIVSFIKDNTDICEIVSCNLDCWCRSITSELGVPCHFSRAVVDNGHVIGVDYIMDKRSFVANYKSLGYRVVFVGDSVNDFAAMDEADFAVLLDNGYLHKDVVDGNFYVATSDGELIVMIDKYINGRI